MNWLALLISSAFGVTMFVVLMAAALGVNFYLAVFDEDLEDAKGEKY